MVAQPASQIVSGKHPYARGKLVGIPEATVIAGVSLRSFLFVIR